jgi:hypothetical protein
VRRMKTKRGTECQNQLGRTLRPRRHSQSLWSTANTTRHRRADMARGPKGAKGGSDAYARIFAVSPNDDCATHKELLY